MKKITAILLALGLGVAANASNSLMKKTKGSIYGITGSTITYIYSDVETKNMRDKNLRNLLENRAKKSLCDDKDMRALIENGLVVQYIYLSTGNKDGAIFSISDCD